jgi:hypothetical protein
LTSSGQEVARSGSPLSRRSLLKTAAWATPVIAFAAAAPLASASPEHSAVTQTQISVGRIGTYGGVGAWNTATGPLLAITKTTAPTITLGDDFWTREYPTGPLTCGWTMGSYFTSMQFYTASGTLLALNDVITTASGSFVVTTLTANTFAMTAPSIMITSGSMDIVFPELAAKVVTQTAGAVTVNRTINFYYAVEDLSIGSNAGVVFVARV